MTIYAKILTKILANQISEDEKRITHDYKVELILGLQAWLNIRN